MMNFFSRLLRCVVGSAIKPQPKPESVGSGAEALGQQAFNNINGFYNFRPVGNYVVQGDRIVRPGVVFRSANLDHVSSAGVEILRRNLGVCCIFDLRSEGDSARPNPLLCTKKWIQVHQVNAMDWEKSREPVQEHFSLLSENLVPSFMVIYEHLLVESAPAFRAILTHLINNPGHPIIVHCDLGKDRTGIFIALLLKLLGVTEDDIVEDFHATEGQIDALIPGKTEKYRRSPFLKQSLIAIENHFLAPKEVMKAFLAHVQDVYGGIENYMAFIGINTCDINRIRQNLLFPLKCK